MTTRCCVVGGGPAGKMLGYLWGRAGIETLVLEKHADFLRDFGGDIAAPLPIRIVGALPWLQGLTARVIGLGIRQEYVQMPDIARRA